MVTKIKPSSLTVGTYNIDIIGDITGDITGNVTGDVTGNVTGSVSGTAGSISGFNNPATAATASTIVYRDGSGDITTNVFQGVASTARYADLAEKYLTDEEYPVGTVLVFGGAFEVTAATQVMDRRIAGVVSEKPAYLMNSESDGAIVALTGRVPCRVIGTIKKGDMLVSSGVRGVATSDSDPKTGAVIGKALENYDSQSIGTIEVVVGRL